MFSDIEIANHIKPKQITQIANSIGIRNDELKLYGNYIAKVSLPLLERLQSKPNGRLIILTSITPTKFGEGKTSTAIGLTQGLGKLKKKVVLCLREPSIGPVFGIKGGACGGGYSQIMPMEDINLHFTGDGHTITAANNLLCAMLDGSIYFKNRLNVDSDSIVIRRVSDISDRTLRDIEFRVGKDFSYKSGFDITAASEIMAIMALAKDIEDLKARLSRIVIAFDKNKKPITPQDLNAVGAMAVLLKDAVMPNLVQTMEGEPAFVHCGPFANIAHGANSVISLLMALKLADYVVTETGFGSELGAEKFFDIVCRQANLKVELAVIVASVRAVKVHGFSNLTKHVEIIRGFGVIPIVAINKFPEDTQEDLEAISRHCSSIGVASSISEAVAKGGAGALELAENCIRLLQQGPSNFRFLYEQDSPIREKIGLIASKIYGADGVDFSKDAEADLRRIEELDLGSSAVNIAKTQFSLSDNPKLSGMPKGWRLQVNRIRICAGAGFIVPVAGDILLMPGLPEKPAALNIDTDNDGNIKGLS